MKLIFFFFWEEGWNWLSMRSDCISSAAFVFLFFIFYFFYWEAHFTWDFVCQWISCIVHGTHYLFDQQNFHWNDIIQWVPYIVHRTHKLLFSTKFLLKMSLTALFTHLKIILLQYFQFSVFSKISCIQTGP